MKITDVRTVIVGNPWKNWVFVIVETDAGLSGLGEATRGLETKSVEGDIAELRRHVIGEDPRQPERLWMKMHKARYLGASSGMSAIEQACWDILGKSLGVPCWQLFGGKHHQRLRVYANGWYQGPREPGFFAQAAIHFNRSTPGLTSTLVGMSQPAHVRENLRAAARPGVDVNTFWRLLKE